MKREEMFAIARRDLVHIPKGEVHQGMLRATYWMMRLNSLGKKHEYPNDPQQLIARAVADVQRLVPSAHLEFDQNYFSGEVS